METELDWNGQLSFAKLKQEGLVNNYNEWNSLRNTVKPIHCTKKPTTQFTCPYTAGMHDWLEEQQQPFRVSPSAFKLISGFIRLTSLTAKDIFQDIQNIIISYCNLFYQNISCYILICLINIQYFCLFHFLLYCIVIYFILI